MKKSAAVADVGCRTPAVVTMAPGDRSLEQHAHIRGQRKTHRIDTNSKTWAINTVMPHQSRCGTERAVAGVDNGELLVELNRADMRK